MFNIKTHLLIFRKFNVVYLCIYLNNSHAISGKQKLKRIKVTSRHSLLMSPSDFKDEKATY